MNNNAHQLIHILLTSRVISAPKLQRGIELAEEQQRPLLPTLISQGILTAETINQACAAYYQLDIIDLSNYNFQDLPLEYIDSTLCKTHLILPIAFELHQLKIALCDPDVLPLVEAMKFRYGFSTKAVFANYTDLSNLINSYLHKYHLNSNTPTITAVEQIITDAIIQRASDIHFEPTVSNQLRIRFRIDGLLHTVALLSNDQVKAVISRLKILANLDIALHRLPQDGRFTFKTNQGLLCDIRMSTCPTLLGEKVVIRLLESDQPLLDINELGLNDFAKQQFTHALHQPQGLILVTGPTGSGKTQTLYSAIKLFNQEQCNILTIEDPVEIQIPGINQVHVNEKAELTFTKALRAFLRQDPDIILIGEIRDLETAETAIRAAQTGHLVLSTLHTNSAQETLTRLSSMGIPHYQLTHTITCILAQRLARRLCEQCKSAYSMSREEWLSFKPSSLLSSQYITLYQAVGCPNCLNGYKRRCGLFEVMPISLATQQSMKNSKEQELSITHLNCQFLPTQSLWQAGLEKVAGGITSLQEIRRVIQHE